MHEKSIQNRCKIDARKSDAKSMENDAKMEAEWSPTSLENLKICEQNACQKLMLKFGAEKKANADFEITFLDRSQLPTAIFPHRALEKRKREVKTSFGLCFEWIQKDYNRNCCKMHVKIISLGPKTCKISPNWHSKSMSKP